MKNNKWSVESFSSKPIHVVLFVSRKKDNKEKFGEDFKERRKSFITNKTIEELYPAFSSFVKEGREGELSRFYYSVNARDPVKIHRQLLHFLIDSPDFNLCSIDPKLAGIAAQKECALEKKWMFDFDIDDETKAEEFEDDLENELIKYCQPKAILRYRPPRGSAFIIGEHEDDLENEPIKYCSSKTIVRYKTPHGYAIVVENHFDTRELMNKWAEDVTLKRDDLLCVDWRECSED